MGLRSVDGTPEWKRDLPPIPKWKPEATHERVLQIHKAALRLWQNSTLDAETRVIITEMLQHELGLTKAAIIATMETLLPYSEKMLTPPLARTLCYQFAVNWQSLKKGVPVRKFTGLGTACWVPMEIAGFDKETRGKHLFVKMYLDIVDGSYAGHRATRMLPYGFLHILARDLGFTHRRPYEELKDLVDLRFAAWVEPSTKDDINFDKYWLTSAMEKQNNCLVKARKPTERELEEQDAEQ